MVVGLMCCFLFKQKTAYEMRISDWSSDVCSSDLLGELQVELRRRDRGLGGAHAGVALCAGGLAGLELLARDRLGLDQGLRTRILRLRQLGFGAGALQLRLRLVECRLVGARVDHEQQVALLEDRKSACRERVCQYV